MANVYSAFTWAIRSISLLALILITATVSGQRITTDLVSEYHFTEGAGTTVYDVSGVAPAADLHIGDESAISWVPGGGLSIDAPTILKTNGAATKHYNALYNSPELSLELWIDQSNLNQYGPARIMSYSVNTASRNYTLGQEGNEYRIRNRTTTGDNQGFPEQACSQDIETGLQHVVYTFNVNTGQEKWYIDNELVDTDTRSGDLSNWDSAYEFAIANEITMDRPWMGDIYLAAIYCQVLDANEVDHNYNEGLPGSGDCCSVTPATPSAVNGCAVLSAAPVSDCGGQVEFMWAQNVNGSIVGLTPFSVDQSLEYCPSESGNFRICVRAVGCNTIYESNDVYVDVDDVCATITNGSSPYPADDPYFQEVISYDPYCCNTWWDNICQGEYIDEATTGELESTCTLDGYNAVNGRIFWIPNFGTDFKAAGSGLFFDKFDDGTAHIYGMIERISDSNDQFYVSIWYENESTYAEFTANGGEAKDPQLGDETTWTFYTLDDTKTSILVGSGDLSGESLQVVAQDNNYGLQIGDGANALNSNPNGFSMWFDYIGTTSGHGDINATIDCGSPEPSVESFELDCDDALKVTVDGIGMEGQSCASIDVDAPGNLEYVILEAVWKGSNPPATVTFTADGAEYVASAQTVVEGNGSDQGNKRAYRVEVPASSTVGVCNPSGYNNNLRSLVAYAFSSNAGSTSAGSGEFVGRHLYNASYTMTLPVPASDEARDIVVTLPLSDMSDDGRNADFDITAGPVNKHYTITGNTNGLSLNITPFVLENVPGDVTEVVIDLISDPSNNPSSFLAAGLAIADAQCETPEEENICEVVGYNGPGQRHFWFANDFGQDWTSTEDGLQWIEYADGTAKLTGSMYRISDSSQIFDVVMYFSNKSNYSEWTAMGKEAKLCGDATEADAEEWTYYMIDTSRPSVLTGRDDLETEYLFLADRTDMNFGLQLGSNGANCKNDEYGFSIWFEYSGTASGHGDINANLNCEAQNCEIECVDDLTLDCESSIDPAYTGYPTLVCNGVGDCDREAGEFDFEFQGWGGATDGWSFGTGWQVGTGCDPACGDIPNVFIDFTNFHTDYNTKLKSPVYDACCTDDVYLSFCMQQDLYGGEDVPGYLAVQYRVNGGEWQTLNTYQNVYGSTVNYDDTYEIAGAAGQSFEVRFKAYGEGSNYFTMGGWGIDNVRVYGQSSGCSTPSEVDIDWSYSDSSTGSCPEVITRTFSGEYAGETYSCEQTITIVDEEAPVFTSVPEDAEFSCSETVAASSASAIDNCDDDVTVTQSDEIIGADCNYYIERTFVATDDCGNTATYVQTITIIDDLPTVTATSTDDNCSQNEGTITLSFEDSACRTHIQLSIDGGNSFVNVPDNSGSYTFTGLGEGDYDIVTKWGDGDCITDGDDVHINDNDEIELEIKNLGICIVDLYEWLPGGDQFVEELAPGESIIVTTHLGAMWRIVADNWQPNLFDEQYTVEGCYDQVWNVAPDYCQADCILEVDITGDTNPCEGEETTLTAEVSNESECIEIINCYTMGNAVSEGNCINTPGTGVIWQRAEGCQGSHTVWAINGELKLTEFADGTATIKGSIVNTENGDIGIVDVTLYDKEDDGNTWNASCYLNGISGPEIYYTSFLGTITVGDEVFTIEEKVSEKHFILADGAGFNPGEYGLGSWTAGTFGGCTEWFASLTPCEIPSQELTYEWSTGETTQTITVSEAGDYTVTVTDCAGCVAMDDVHITFDELPEVTVSSTDVDCVDNNGTITFTFVDNPARTNIEFSIDGGATWPAEYNVLDNTGSFTITGLAPGTYDLAVRWGNDECEVDLPDETIEEGCFSTPTVEEGVADAVTVECDEALPTDEPIFADACDGNLNVEFNETQNDLDCGYELIRTWTATNDCGQATSVSQTITVVDTTAPVLEGVPADETVSCDIAIPAANVTATDNCDDNVVVTLETTYEDATCPELGVTIYTWTATDNCGNTTSASQRITSIDDANPVVEGVPADVTVECDDIPAPADVTGFDFCSEIVSVELDEDISGATCPYTITRTWTVTDACGQMASASQVITVEDTTAPVLVGVPADQIGLCDDSFAPVDVTATDNCDDDVDVSVEETINGAGCNYTITFTYTATDDCGNTSVASYDVVVLDETAPVLEGIPADMTINCDEDPADANVTATDNCDTDVAVMMDETINDLDCGSEIIRTWTATDDCGNSVSASQTITVVDTEAPVITSQTPDQTIECDQDIPEINVTFVDNCDSDLTVSVDNWINELDCGYEYVKYCTATDDCGNTAEATVTITVLDTTAPEVVSAPADVTIECDEDEPTDMPVFADNCDDDLDISAISGIVQLDCGYEIQRSWTATDDCGNSTIVNQVITVVDTTAPMFNGVPADATVECDDIPGPAAVTATDNCDDAPVVTVADHINLIDDCSYEIERVWTAVDNCGNENTATQILTVTDTTAPEVVSTPADVTVTCDEALPTEDAEFTDNCDDNLHIEMEDVIVDQDCGYIIERSWVAVDDCDNAVSTTQIITVIDDQAPVITFQTPDQTIECDQDIPEINVTYVDNCDSELTISVNNWINELDCGYEYVKYCSATDDCGNMAEATVTITVLDTTAPEVVSAPADVTIECDEDEPTDMPVFADNCDDDLDISAISGIVQLDCGYEIQRSWTATDDCGNSTTVNQVITVVDTTAPEFTSTPADYTVNCDNGSSDPEFAGEPTATDNCDDNLVITFEDTVAPDVCPATFERTWTATDNCGNAVSYVQLITINDFAAPTLEVPADVTVECTESTDPLNTGEATAADDCSVPMVSYEDGPITGDCPYTFERVWTAVDACGNTVSGTQVITIEDTVAPVADGEGFHITISCDEELPEVYMTFTDNCDENIEVTVTTSMEEDGCNVIFYQTCTATDDCGNQTSVVSSITVVDETAPILIGVPADATIDCTDEVPDAIVVAQDNCDDEPVVSLTAETVYHDCGYQIVRTWTAMDECGNTYSESQTLDVVDVTAPEIECPADYVVNCDNGSSDPEFAGEPVVTDNCSSFEVTYADGPATDDCPATFERTWTATDACGNSSSCVQIITINDFAAPMIECPADVTIECTESTDPMNTGEATATDDCSTPVITYVDGPTTGDCPYTFERTWTATDPCGNSTSCVQVITIEDTVAPVLSGDDEELTVECNVSPTIVPPTATDNCDEDVEITLSTETIPGDCPQESTDIYTWTAMDECGNTAVRTLTINFIDTTAPILIGVPADQSIDCDADVPDAIVVAQDNCDDNPVVSLTAETVYHDCGYDIVRTWTAVDACGNTYSESQTLNVFDETAPEIECPADYVVNCDNGSSDPEFAGEPVVTDNCSSFEVTYEDGPATDDCPATFERTWTATDACGNASSCVQIITINDFAAPMIECPADVTIECTESTDPMNTGEATATDDCSTPVITYVDGPTTGDCPYTFERTWTATDPCGNSTSCVQVITIEDTVAPVLSGEDEELTVECNVSPTIVPPTATDNCDEDVEITLSTETIPGDCPQESTDIYTWTAMDECGNTAVRTLTINFIDTTAPILIGVPADQSIDCDADVPDAIVVAQDNCDDNPVVSLTAETVYHDCGYDIVRTWTAVDACGNTYSESQTLNVFDETAPEIECPADYVVNCDNGSSDPEFAGEPVVTDNCSSFEVTYADGPATDDCPATFERTWTATDACGNSSSCVQIITINDFAAPMIECPADVTIECTESTDPMNTGEATATDDCSTPVITYVDGPTTGDCPYTFERTWTATDPCGNSTSCVQVITIEDTVAPVLSGDDEELTVECNVSPTIVPPTATDNCDEDVEITLSTETIPGDCPQESTDIYTWTAMDECGNTAVRTLTINFIDTTAPILIGVPADQSIDCDADVPDAIVVAQDNCDDNPVVSLTAETVYHDCGYDIVRTWTAVDACGNTYSESQTLNVFDETAPEIECPADYVVNCDNGSSDPEFAGEPVVTDNCSSFEVTYADGPATDDCPATFERTWTATDACGNSSSCVQIITINDFAAPMIECPADVTIECTESTDPMNTGEATATDDCSTPVITYVDGPTTGDCPYTFERTWTATDPCGNSTSCVQVITIEDTVAPVLSGDDEELTVECNVSPTIVPPTATDNCDEDVEITLSTETIPGDCPQESTDIYTWTAMDECGNTAVRTLTINFVDTTAPVLEGTPENMTVECTEIPAAAVVTATDNCDEPAVIYNEDIFDLPCGQLIERTWTATDACGNTTSYTQTIDVVDTVDPMVDFAPQDVTIECDEDEPTDMPMFSDNCDDELEITAISGINNVTDCGYTIERSWTATDDCGNSTTVSQTITVIDTTAPVMEGVPADVTVECTDIPEPAMVTATDNCDDAPVVEMTETITGGCPYNLIRTWTATDACGNQSIMTQTITVIDEEAPVLVGVPADFNGECGDAPSADMVTAIDNCDENVPVIMTEEVIGESCPLTIIRTWTATDNCGNMVSDSQTITINDTTAPEFTSTPADFEVECDMVPGPDNDAIEVADNCDETPVITYDEVIIPGDPVMDGAEPCGYTIERTWTATDLCGNEASFTQIVTVVDTTAPDLVGVPADVTVECTDIPDAPVVTAVDNCYDGEMTVTFDESIVPQTCGYLIVRTWTVEDNCWNYATESQVITVVDTEAPVVLTTPADETIECDEALPTGMPTFEDACDDELSVEMTEMTEDLACGYQLIRTWTATDDCGNAVSTSQSIFVVDTVDPVLAGVPADMDVECSDIPAAAVVTATDNCDMDVAINFEEVINAGECPYTIVRTWTATDDCGNMVSASQTLTVVDTVAPVLEGVPADATVECDDIPAAPVVTASDNCDDDLMVVFTDEVVANGDCGYMIVRTWTVEDNCGNEASASQTLTVTDTTSPSILTQPASLALECDEEVPFEAPTFEDNCDEDLEVGFNEAIVPGDCANSFTIVRTWVAMDDCGNEVSVVQNIEISDNTAPVLSGVPADADYECTDIPAPAEVTATDNCDMDVTVTYNENFTDLDCGFMVTRMWTATDACGNSVTESQTITAIDTTNPVVEFAPADVTIECDEEEPAGMPIFSDNCDDELDITAISGIVQLDCGYLIERSWTATDDCGNSTVVSQTITVVDTTAPVLEGTPADMTVECDDIPAPAVVTATDNCDETLEVMFSEEVISDGCPYTIERTWTVMDDCGNADSYTQTLSVVDNTDPVLVGAPADETVECDAVPGVPTVSATDNCADNLMVTFVEVIEDLECGYLIYRTWSTEDECGNTASATQEITVVDTTAPVLVGVPADAIAECDDIPEVAVVTATDNCTEDLTVSFIEETIDQECGYLIIRTWTVHDECDNTTSESQVISVVDTTAPVIVSAPEDATVQCDEVPGVGTIEATDNCDNMLTVDVAEENEDADCGYIITRTYTVTDDCGNAAIHVQVITVTDTEAPVITGVPADVTIECGEDVPAPGDVEVEDNCDPMPVVTSAEVTETLDCGYQIVRTYTATDECGNEATATQTITVSDFTPPVFDSMPEDITVNCDEVTIAPSLTATDNCDDNVEITFDEVIGEGCPYTILRTWTATDDCGNEATTTQLVTVIDEVAPEFDEFEVFISIECDQVDDYIITASDNCDASVEVTIIEELIFSGGCIGTLQRTYQAMDDCGNTVTTTQLLQVVDTTAPELFNVPADVEIDCEDEVPAVADDIFATDNCSEDVTIEFTEVQTSEFCPYEIIRTWTAIDNCNNVTEGVQVITVTVDTPELVSLVTYPNPTDDRFTVEFSVPRDAEVAACVYDMAGREVMPVFKGTADARRLYQLEFSAFEWEAGSYVIMMTVDDKVYHHRMIITQQK
ncbi:HYR-like domain-containing protein [Sanyastnella coralliicola]|uniref:HYR-like domain-containing protein n=1 Tax=Sanyastnella coralliicola TaxID=3069118 RepID=UPI0027B8F34C|nr:LamG-like jellyroll fold domain-containing protein [Longitalea sp. SCSIO 12813]